jgi:hypothetical protein
MRKVIDCQPVGYTILVELLTAQEALGTQIHIDDSQQLKIAPQAYILKIGPFVKEEKDYNFNVGDRVVLAGNFTPIPEIPHLGNRKLAIVEPHAIKAVLIEGEEVSELLLAKNSPLLIV